MKREIYGGNIVSDGIIQVITIMQLIIQYLLLPRIFLLTFILPAAVFMIARKYLWFSVLLTAVVELLINWDNFTYYESRGLMILFTLVQLAVMAMMILLLKCIDMKRKA